MAKSKKKIPPTNDNEILVFAKNLLQTASKYINKSPKVWPHVTPEELELVAAALSAFMTSIETWRETPTKNNRIDKDKKKEVLRQAIIVFLNDYVRKNSHVTAAQRAALGLAQEDTTSTPVKEPAMGANADYSLPAIGEVELHNFHPVRTPTVEEELALYGLAIYYGVVSRGGVMKPYHLAAEPKSGEDLACHKFTTRKKFTLKLPGESGNKVFICLRYENQKSEPGPFGPMIIVTVP